VWTTVTDSYHADVAYTRAVDASVAALRAKYPGLPIVGHATAFSLESLRASEDRLIDMRRRLKANEPSSDVPDAIRATKGDYDVSIDVIANKVIIDLPTPPAGLDDALWGEFGDAVAVEIAPLAVPAQCQGIFNCYPAMLGGLFFDGNTGDCSTGFLAGRGAQRGMLTAGHCWDNGNNHFWSHNGTLYGHAAAQALQGNTDGMWVEREANTPFRDSSKFFVENEAVPRPVLGVIPRANIGPPHQVGKTGARTGTTFGNVVRTDFSPGYVPNAAPVFVLTEACGGLGDSGGAVFDGNNAVGIFSGIQFVGGCFTDGEHGRMIYDPIDIVTATLNVNVVGGQYISPTAAFSNSCTVAGKCSFNGGASNDPDGLIQSWFWDFGSGNTASGRQVQHTFLIPGNHLVQLTVRDVDGLTGYVAKRILVT
jgi:hypothetical protein